MAVLAGVVHGSSGGEPCLNDLMITLDNLTVGEPSGGGESVDLECLVVSLVVSLVENNQK